MAGIPAGEVPVAGTDTAAARPVSAKKFDTSTGLPSSRTVKSSWRSPVTGFPCLSVT